MSQIVLENQNFELSDERLKFTLTDVNSTNIRIVAHLEIDIGGGQKMVIGNHSEALENSTQGRVRLAEYPQYIQDWIIPGIWGNEPTVATPNII